MTSRFRAIDYQPLLQCQNINIDYLRYHLVLESSEERDSLHNKQHEPMVLPCPARDQMLLLDTGRASIRTQSF